MNHKAEILKTRFTKSIINSKVSHVNSIILLKESWGPFYRNNDHQTS